MNQIQEKIAETIRFLQEKGQLQRGNLVIIGCSTSEVIGGEIGQKSAPEVGMLIAKTAIDKAKALGLHVGFQCCEHLNRAVCIEKEVLLQRGYTQVAAIPQPKAGGSVPAAAWELLSTPVLALKVQGEGVIDIGDTLVGMHIKPVAVPLRMPFKEIGQAHLTLAYARLPYIGGERAVYPQKENK